MAAVRSARSTASAAPLPREMTSPTSNAAAVRFGHAVGEAQIVSLARASGITSRLAPVPSIALGALEFKLLHFLASQPRRVFSREQLLDNVWGRDRFVTPRTVDVHIRRLREKIEARGNAPRYVQTVRGSGYRFSPGTGAPGESEE